MWILVKSDEVLADLSDVTWEVTQKLSYIALIILLPKRPQVKFKKLTQMTKYGIQKL
jgi:hypothetical protein